MRKILLFNPKPSARAYPRHADCFGILEGNDYDVFGILCNKFVSLMYLFFYRADAVFYLHEYSFRKMFEFEKISKRPSDMVEFVKKAINVDKYVTLVLNARKLSSLNYAHDRIHSWIIYGYDDDAMEFTAAGYKPEDNFVPMYESIKIKYLELDEAWSFPESINRRSRNYRKTKSYFNRDRFVSSLPSSFVPEQVNLKKLRIEIFLYANNFLPFIFNAKLYRIFIKKLKKKHKKEPLSLIDPRGIKVLQEHKKILLLIINRIAPTCPAAVEYNVIHHKMNLVLMLATKYNLKRIDKEGVLNKIINLLLWISENEPRILHNFYTYARKNGLL